MNAKDELIAAIAEHAGRRVASLGDVHLAGAIQAYVDYRLRELVSISGSVSLDNIRESIASLDAKERPS